MALCVVLGAIGGKWSKPAKDEPKASAAALQPAAPVFKAEKLTATPLPPPFTSITASMEWVKTQMEAGNPAAAELLFHKDAGLTDAQREQLANELVRSHSYRRMNPRVLARILLSLPPGNATTRALNEFFSQWCGDDAEDALRYLETMPADRLNTILLTYASFGLTRLPAERVAAFAGKLDDKGRAFLADGLVTFANQAGAWRNTSAILSQMNAKPEKDARSVEWQLAVNLADIAPQEVESRIANETDPAKRAELLGGYALSTGIRDPEQGVRLNAQIQQPEMRERHLAHHVGKWLRTDRSTALAWLQSSEAAQIMSAEQRAVYLRSYGLEASR